MSMLKKEVVEAWRHAVITEGEGLDLQTQIILMKSYEILCGLHEENSKRYQGETLRELRAEVSELQDVVKAQQYEIEAMRVHGMHVGGR